MDFIVFWHNISNLLTSVPSTGTLFNQYRDCNPEVDLPGAAAIRLANLRSYMEQACRRGSILVVGEAAGPWGARFSGVPFTGERQLLDPSFPLRGERSSVPVPLKEIRLSPPFISNSARAFWGGLSPHHHHFVAWDAVPFHTHKPGDPFSVRNPHRREVLEYAEPLRLIAAFIEPIHIVAIGRHAFTALASLGYAPTYVRHPSQGGKSAFVAGIREIFGSAL